MANRSTLSWAAEALYWYKRYDDSNPDVGMGPTLESLLDDLIEKHKSCFSEDEKRWIIQKVHKMCGD